VTVKDLPRSPYAPYALAVVSVAVALAARLALNPLLGDRFLFLFFYLPVAVTVWYGGFRPAAVAALLGGLAADYFLLFPKPGFSQLPTDLLLGLTVYLATSLSIAALSGSMYAAQRKATTLAAVSRRQRIEIENANRFLEARVLERTQQLITSENRLRLLVESIDDYAIFMLNANGDVLTWHKGAQQIYGYQDSEIVGQHYSLLFPPEATANGDHQTELADAQATGKYTIEGWRLRKGGTQFWASGTTSAVFDSERKLVGYVKVTHDLTAKRRNDELLHSILDNTLDAIITIDDHHLISMINHAGEKMFGYSFHEIIGAPAERLFPVTQGMELDAALASSIAIGDARIIGMGNEVRGQRQDGSTFPLAMAITEFSLDQNRYFVFILRDISEQRKLEAQLIQAQKMEAFGQLAGGVAHDFNNLLTLINGYSQILQRMVPVGDAKQKMLGQIFRAGQRAAALTQQLLAFSRQQVLEPKVIDINSIVGDTEIMLRRLIGEDIELTTVLYPHLSAVKADPGQIEQVILNLAVNARDSMPVGGKLTIETSQVDSGAPLGGHAPRHVMISISDTGAGMTPEVRSRAFEPFFTTKGIGKGTGLGLAVAHGIVKQSGGTIEIYSEPGLGTTLKIRLPALMETVESSADNGHFGATLGTETLLLVEDDDNVREFVTLSLQSFGYAVIAAPDGKAAVSLYANRKNPIDLVVTDVVMPDMSGRVLAETLRENSPDLKVLFVSGYTDDAVVRHGILQANVAFLQKPFTPDALARKVREVIDKS
jgi:two-component system cell cycle sensor histidine kinase/response regulator CckA